MIHLNSRFTFFVALAIIGPTRVAQIQEARLLYIEYYGAYFQTGYNKRVQTL